MQLGYGSLGSGAFEHIKVVHSLERQLRQYKPQGGEMNGSSLDQPGRIDRGAPEVAEEADGNEEQGPFAVNVSAKSNIN